MHHQITVTDLFIISTEQLYHAFIYQAFIVLFSLLFCLTDHLFLKYKKRLDTNIIDPRCM